MSNKNSGIFSSIFNLFKSAKELKDAAVENAQPENSKSQESETVQTNKGIISDSEFLKNQLEDYLKTATIEDFLDVLEKKSSSGVQFISNNSGGLFFNFPASDLKEPQKELAKELLKDCSYSDEYDTFELDIARDIDKGVKLCQVVISEVYDFGDQAQVVISK